jgi:DNA polymerase-1
MLLLDGSSLLYRAFFALPMLTTSQGEVTNAVYGFTMMLFRVLKEESPDHLAVALDLPAPTFRHQLFAEYKATRPRAPEELCAQIELAHELLDALGIAIVEEAGYEADDVIGTLADRAAAAGHDVLIVTGDLDALQLVSDRISILVTRRGITDTQRYDAAEVRKRFGLEPAQLVDYRALKGDPTDNIPGVPGVGEKTAIALLQQFGTLENLLAHLEDVSSPRTASALETFSDQARRARELSAIVRDVPVGASLTDLRRQPLDSERTIALFRRLEFKSLLRELETAETRETEHQVITSAAQLEALVGGAAVGAHSCAPLHIGRGELALEVLATGGPPMSAEVVGLALLPEEGGAGFLPAARLVVGRGLRPAPPSAGDGTPALQLEAAAAELGALLRGRGLIVHDLKRAQVLLARLGLELSGPAFDAMLASYVLNPTRKSHDLAAIAFDQLQITLPEPLDIDEAAAEGRLAELAAEGAHRAELVRRLRPLLDAALANDGVLELYRDLELPLARVLARMELAGVALDAAWLEQLSTKLESDIARLEQDIYALAGEEFTINSPRQVQTVLFDKLGLPRGKRTKTGFSTGADVLRELAPQFEIVQKILDYRELTKLKGTYIDALPRLLHPETGRLHTSLNQTVTATGRLSSSEPNLQNIPIRTAVGQEIRRAFIAGPGGELLSADYSQIELRVLAHITGDEHLTAIFREGRDLHAATASEIFGVAADRVAAEMRRLAKVVNFGIPYGISAFRLARDMGISPAEAQLYMDRYFERFPRVAEYVQRIVREAREQGYVTTLLGRKRRLPDLHSRSRQLREFAERTAINTPIQGSAADIIKLAMLRVDTALARWNGRARMILQIHDELLFEVEPAVHAAVGAMVAEEMVSAYTLAVPLQVEVKVGPNWLDMKPLG